MTRRPLLAALPLLLALGACTGDADDGDDLPRAGVGEVIPILGNQVEGRHSWVLVPGARYDFTVGSPRERMDSFAAEDAGVSAEAGDGRRFVEIEWSLDAAPGDTFVMEAPEDVEPMLTVTADGERYEVGSLRQEGLSAAAVVVPADADDIGFQVEYDGLTQTVEDAYDAVVSRAEGGPDSLYFDTPSVRWENCEETRLSGGRPAVSFFGVDCKANISSPVPYFGPLGWAPKGRAWVVVRFLAGSPDAGYDAPGDYVEYTVGPSEVRLRIEGADTPELFPLEDGAQVGLQDDGSWEAQAVFLAFQDVGDPDLQYQRLLSATPDDPDEAVRAGAPSRLYRVQDGVL